MIETKMPQEMEVKEVYMTKV